ncbi:MAG: biotin-dependent carboxyltransferase family protein [Nocardioides sp.]
MGRSVTVVDSGPLTTVQDAGRPGLAHLGVPRSGFLDGKAARLANRLVGNDPDVALLETTVGGVALRADAAWTVAVTGAVADVLVDGRGVAWGEPVTVAPGALLRIGPARSGVRSYVAVSGGILVDEVLGSRSTDTLSGLGPAPLTVGDVLALGTGSLPRPADVPRLLAADGMLRVTPGPRADWVEGGVRRWATASWTVAPDSNRVALRLSGDPLVRRVEGELPSEGVVLGSVQVPPDGQPLVFLADHPTTGGYPVVGVVHPDDLWQCAQLRPGEAVGFRQVAG